MTYFMKAWSQVVESSHDRDPFEDNWNSVQRRFSEYPSAVSKVKKWLRFKVHLIDSLINNVTHFDQVNSSRAEGSHAVYTRFLYTSQAGLYHASESFLAVKDLCIREIMVKMANARTSPYVVLPTRLSLLGMTMAVFHMFQCLG
jgi:hypothetical protein